MDRFPAPGVRIDKEITALSDGLVNFLKPAAQSLTDWGKEYSHQRSTRTRTYR